ncbi:MAG: hypothetical protein CV082_05660 [Candidatus Brocadia sp. BL1]|nr:MAG: hypothetical protein CV082_05660 [Candidatus Brocadia sp. BL1]
MSSSAGWHGQTLFVRVTELQSVHGFKQHGQTEFVHATRKLIEIKWKFLYNFSPFPLYPQCLCGKEDVSRRECKEFLNH